MRRRRQEEQTRQKSSEYMSVLYNEVEEEDGKGEETGEGKKDVVR